MYRAKIIGATSKELSEATVNGTTKVVISETPVLISSIVVTNPTSVDGTDGTTTLVFYDGDDNTITKLITGASGEGSLVFPAPLKANGLKVASVATVAGKVTVFVID